MTILWGRGNFGDRSKMDQACLADLPHLFTEKFPGHDAQTNLVEIVWQITKHAQRSNFTLEQVAEPRVTVAAKLEQQYRKPP